VARVWASAPTRNYLTQDDQSNWPDPWTLISDNCYCDVAVALGIFYTLYLSNYPQKESLRLVGYRLRKNHKEYNLVVCEEEKYVLNYDWGHVVNIPDLLQSEKPIYNFTPSEILK
jgi:hypothetical protein